MAFITYFFDWQGIAFVIVTLFWIMEFKIFPSAKNKKNQENKKNKKTGKTSTRKAQKSEREFRVILTAIIITIAASIGFTLIHYGIVGESVRALLKSVGVLIYILGLILRYWCSSLLGPHFTRFVSVENTQKLVSSGPYRFIRHPLYLWLLLLTLGVPVFFGNWLAFLLGFLLMFWALDKRIKTEENELTIALGSKYTKWKRKRYKLIPLIY